MPPPGGLHDRCASWSGGTERAGAHAPPRSPDSSGDSIVDSQPLARGLQRGIALMPVAARIADALARLESCLGGEAPRLSREALAALVGARRETVCRAAQPRRRRSAVGA